MGGTRGDDVGGLKKLDLLFQFEFARKKWFAHLFASALTSFDSLRYLISHHCLWLFYYLFAQHHMQEVYIRQSSRQERKKIRSHILSSPSFLFCWFIRSSMMVSEDFVGRPQE
jgi:Na+/H+ antiporter NhaD/arsenite permease-like protein